MIDAAATPAPPVSAPNAPLAVVTGASSGIGEALALKLAAAGHDLILVGRDTERLETVAAQVSAQGRAAQARGIDLADSAAREALAAELAACTPDVLVNNAGFGAYGPFDTIDPALTQALIETNIAALARLTAAVLPGMRARGAGRILNVASTGAFAPLPFAAAYGASKAFVLSFSEAVNEELKGSGVTVTALCPGPTATRFFRRAGWDGTRLFQGPMATAEHVADCGLKALMAGRPVEVVGVFNTALVTAARLTPRRLVNMATRVMLASRPR